MSNPLVPSKGSPFDSIRQVNEHGAEFWSARDLQPHLGYDEWRSFKKAIKRAVVACRESGYLPEHQFASVAKVILAGKGAEQRIEDFALSRYACYLIAQNCDPTKAEIARAQTYFAIQTRRQELSDAEEHDRERIELREQAKQEFKALSGAAQDAGVSSPMFGVFHDAGYKGQYGGLGQAEIKARKRIPAQDNLMDRMDSTELAANQFRMTQTREKLQRERVHGQRQAIETHSEVGKEVRRAIQKIGGKMPENIPAAEPIKEVKKRLRQVKPKLELPSEAAKGLRGREAPPPSEPTDPSVDPN